jgi:integrase
VPKQNLTVLGLKSLLKKTGRHADGGGLYFRVIGKGKAYFVFRYRLNGVERETSLGVYPELGLEEARVKHAAMRKLVKVDKIDPLAKRQAAKAALTAPGGKPTFGEVADRYLAVHEKSWRNPKHQRQWYMTLTEYCESIRSKPVDQITTDDVLGVLEPIWNTIPETASRLRGRIEAVLDAARARGHTDADKANPARWKGHLAKLLPKPKKLSRGHHAAMPYTELPAFMARLRLFDSVASRALQFTILNASRTSEVLGAPFGEFHPDKALWSIDGERMKIKRAHDVPLSDQALAILRRQQEDHEREGGSNPHVFPGRPMRPLSTMAMSMMLRRLGVPVTVHGFRSSFRDWAAEQGVAFELAEASLAHTIGSNVTRAYLRTSMLELRRPILQKWADYVTGSDADNVITLKRA